MNFGPIFALFFFTSTLLSALQYNQLAKQSIEGTWAGLQHCQLKRMSAYDPRLPRPQVPALEAVVTPYNQVIAYSNEWYGGGYFYQFKNPDGGMSHSITLNRDYIAYQTPFLGQVAHSNRYYTADGVGYNFYCRSQPLRTEAQFRHCINTYFVRVITEQLCRFGGSSPLPTPNSLNDIWSLERIDI